MNETLKDQDALYQHLIGLGDQSKQRAVILDRELEPFIVQAYPLVEARGGEDGEILDLMVVATLDRDSRGTPMLYAVNQFQENVGGSRKPQFPVTVLANR